MGHSFAGLGIAAAFVVAAVTVLGAEPVLAQGVPVEVASRSQKNSAKGDFRAALEAFDAEEYERALELFTASYNKVESPNSRLMVARTLVKLERFADAFNEFTAVIKAAEALARGKAKYEKTLSAAKSELEEVKSRVAIVTINVDGAVTVNGQEVAHKQLGKPMALPPGKTEFSYALNNGQYAQVELDLKAGQTQSADLTIAKPEPEAPVEPQPALVVTHDDGISRTTLGFVSSGVAVLGLASFAVFGLMNEDKFSSLENSCFDTLCPESVRADAEDGRDLQTFANVGLGVGIVGVLGATYFFLSGSSKASAQVETTGKTKVDVGLGEVVVRGTF